MPRLARKSADGVRRPVPRLSPKQLRAIDEYFSNGFRKRGALLKAGYSKSTADHAAASVFNNPLVREEIERRVERDRRKYDVTREWVIQRLARIANAGEILAPYRKVSEDGRLYYDFEGATPDELAVITELTTDEYAEGRGEDAVRIKKMKIAMADPKGALDSLARTLGLFQDSVKVEGEVSVVERLQAGRRRLGIVETGLRRGTGSRETKER